MTRPHQDEQAEPCFIADGPPSSDLPMPPHRTVNLPQMLASFTDGELAKWPDSEREKRRKTRG